MTDFSLYQEDIFRKLRVGNGDIAREEFFFTVIEEHAKKIAERCNARVTLSPKRVWEAQELWESDLQSLIENARIKSSPYPCEYKHAAFLCFWLRRRVIVERVEPLNPSIDVVDSDFFDYTSEYIAFYTAVHLVLYHYYFPKGAGPELELAFLG